MISLNEQQKQAIASDDHHTLVLAGAGSGKTRTLIAKAIRLVENGIAPQRTLLLTFTRKAAKEMTTRLQKEIGDEAHQITAGTFHHFCLQVMRAMPKTFEEGQFVLIDRDDQVELMKMARASYKSKGEKLPQASKLIQMYSYARNTNKGLAYYLDHYSGFDEFIRAKVLQIMQAYESRKEANKYIDYDDILVRFVEKLEENPKAKQQLKAFFDFVLVDEMQDTNPLQWNILNLLKEPAKLFCVGDDAQSIYGFRGADFENIHRFHELVPNAKVFKLDVNYRSTQQILDLSNWLLEQSDLDYKKKLKAAKTEAGPKVKIRNFEDEVEEAEWLCDDILEHKEGSGTFAEIMVMVRSAWSARALEAVFVERGVPYQFIGGTSLLGAAHVKDLLCMIRAALNHRDELAWMRYLTLWPKVGDVTATKVVNYLSEFDQTQEAIYTAEEGCKYVPNKVFRTLLELGTLATKPSSLIEKAIKALEPVLEKKYERWDARKKDLVLLQQLAARHKNMFAFLETYTLDPVTNSVAERVEEEDVLTLITIHSAKGTEADVCYIVQANMHQFPHIRSIGNEKEEEEERRVLYVAMTRARDELIITRTHKHHVFGIGSRAMATKPQNEYFLADIPTSFIDEQLGDKKGQNSNFFSALKGLDL